MVNKNNISSKGSDNKYKDNNKGNNDNKKDNHDNHIAKRYNKSLLLYRIVFLIKYRRKY